MVINKQALDFQAELPPFDIKDAKLLKIGFQSCRKLLIRHPLDASDDSRFQPTYRLRQAICFASSPVQLWN